MCLWMFHHTILFFLKLLSNLPPSFLRMAAGSVVIAWLTPGITDAVTYLQFQAPLRNTALPPDVKWSANPADNLKRNFTQEIILADF